MCGIFAVFGYQGDMAAMRQKALHLSKKLRHRGPDWSGIATHKNNVLCHERLAIVDVESGAQPLTGGDDDLVILCVNGEIYNHKALKKQLKTPYPFKTQSDCEVILPLYLEHGEDFVDLLDGEFAFVLYDGRPGKGTFFAARDPLGVTTLYQGWAKDGSIWFASEMKALSEDCEKVIHFPAGHQYSSVSGKLVQWFRPSWFPETIPSKPLDYALLRETLEAAVVKRLMSDVPYGVLLSGGLDSSLIASIAQRHARKRIEDDEKSEAWWPRLHSFSIGLKNAPDLKFAKEVAEFIGTVHHEYHFTVQEGLDAIHDVIHHLETYDVTTIRASTPMYLLSRKIKATGVKTVLSGEGADEVFGGYLYFHQAPSADAFHLESLQRVKNLQYADNLRANKSTMAWGLECRVPMLDKAFLEVAMNVDPKEKLCNKSKIEKYILRKAFDTPDHPYLPASVLWRQKEQFSDGVGYSWIDSVKASAEAKVTDAEMSAASIRFPYNTPETKEAYYFRAIFSQLFPQATTAATVLKWIPRSDWGCSTDPSGRAQKAHEQHTQ